jgi:hypothetical protein
LFFVLGLEQSTKYKAPSTKLNISSRSGHGFLGA